MVRLFHREYECYLSAEGSFAEQPPVVEDGECHTTHSPHTLSTHSHSALPETSQ